ncbi:MAG: hypothetical protein LC768_02640, partial [Acidobacteria bacterium]|nr:hypothetical protein [Acidobacteriota bacterium]
MIRHRKKEKVPEMKILRQSSKETTVQRFLMRKSLAFIWIFVSDLQNFNRIYSLYKKMQIKLRNCATIQNKPDFALINLATLK